MELPQIGPVVVITPLPITATLRQQLQSWLQEDLGRGDLSAAALKGCRGQAHWIAKANGVFCGGQLAASVFGLMDAGVTTQVMVNDGASISAGTRLLELEGPAEALVGAERTALNLAMRLSGIATATATLKSQLQGSGVQLVDTRKTTPGLRVLEKYAVRCGQRK
jgi:nicotinate-nucleotide pyrophosphorylase (carboxylating)